MADRLQELLQQRALIKEHLAWLEGEISAASGRPAASEVRERFPPALSPAAATASTPAQRSAPRFPASTGTVAPLPARDESDALIAEFAAQEKTSPVPTKKGCWIFFCAALLLVGGAGWAL